MIIQEILNIWNSGGWVMVPLSLLALFIYTTRFKNAKEIIRYSQEDVSSSKHLRNRFEEIHQNLIHNVERKLIFLNTLVASAPLMGLLGTVIGMLGTFSAISSGSGSETVDMVAAGISEALITTQTGLFIALPGIFLILIIRRKKSAIESSIMRLESQSLTSLNLT
jgi:biopolymer transport protein ExbB